MIPSLRDLEHAGCLGRTDVALARALRRLADVPDDDAGVELAVALSSRMISAGHVCLDLAHPPGFDVLLPFGAEPFARNADLEEAEGVAGWQWPEAAAWRAALQRSRLVDTPVDASDLSVEPSADPSVDRSDTPDEARPLVLDAQGRLYLRRYWEHERALARALSSRAASGPVLDEAVLAAGLERLFSQADGESEEGGGALQRMAVESALRHRLCVVSGGPGTGKTSTVARILVLAVEQARAAGAPDPRIVLIAPTGKAAAALTAALGKNLEGLACDDAVRDAVPREASTIHRALGSRGGVGAGFKRDAAHPLAADLVVVDEASMVDLALMRRLVEAVPADARLVMLGDADQLASVEAGAVLADICGGDAERDARSEAPLAGSIVRLEHSYRFAGTSGIGVLSRAVNAGDVASALDVLGDAGHADVEWIDRTGPDWPSELKALVEAGFADLVAAEDPHAGLEALERFRVLSPHRAGPFGTGDLNARFAARFDAGQGGRFEPILVERNDRTLGVFNGDMGLRETPATAGPAARVFFRRAEASETASSVRSLSELRLPPHSACWAMSVHKSQGSEFDTVLVVLPDRMSPVLTREMLYTAITRARERVVIWAPRDVLVGCIERRVERRSGLREALWGAGD